MFVPVLSSEVVPYQIKGILTFMIALVIFPVISLKGYIVPFSMTDYFLLILKEMLIGIIIGFLLNLIFSAVQLGAQFFSTQIGVGMNEVFDPLAQIEIPVLGYFFNAFAVLVFLAIGAHHMVIHAVFDSYRLMPAVDYLKNSEVIMLQAIRYFSFMFEIALKLSFPILAATTIIVICLALIGKTAPQANVLMLGLPIQFLVGILFLTITMSGFLEVFAKIIQNAVSDTMLLFSAIRN